MYTAYLNDNLFFSSSSELDTIKLLSAALDLQAGTAGKFTFKIAPNNVAYDDFEKLTSYIDVYRDTVLIFSGRVIEIKENFDLTRVITCEGLLAILNDSVFRPITVNDTLQNLVQMIIDSHNDQVEADKQLIIGTITIEDEYVYRAYENYDTSISRLSDLVDSYGGYMTVTKQNDGLYFDWQESIAGLNTQGIDFGKNLLDLRQEESATDILTVLIPLGSQITDENGINTRLTITSVNSDKDYIENASGISEYGYVVGIKIWDDVTVPSILKTKAENWLSSLLVNKVSINVSAVDLAYVDSTVDNFMIGQTIHVTSEVHDLDQNFIALKQHLNLLDPSSDRMTLGSIFNGYINTLSKAVKTNENMVESVIHDYVTNETVANINEQLAEQSTLIQQNADSIRSTAETINHTIDGINTRMTAVEQSSDAWNVYINENGETLTYLRVDAQGLWIGRAQDPIQLLETNQAIKFVDSSGNITLLEINTEGINTPSVSVSEQVAFLSGSTPEWAIRKGAVINGKHNLNDLWIGG